MTRYTVEDIRALVEPERVHRNVFEDPDIFELEMERIYGRTWVYIGHVSQVPEPGDYFCTRIGKQPVVVSRHTDQEVYVLYNRCAHRGVKVVNEESGCAKKFMCMYHGWTYDTNGDLDFVTQPEGYPAGFDLDPVEFGMRRVARVETYHGFIFANLSDEGPGLVAYLGANTQVFDDLVLSAPDGEVELAGGVHKYIYRGNWKFQVDNLSDMYHPAYSHESSSRKKSGEQFVRRKGDKGGIQFFEGRGRGQVTRSARCFGAAQWPFLARRPPHNRKHLRHLTCIMSVCWRPSMAPRKPSRSSPRPDTT